MCTRRIGVAALILLSGAVRGVAGGPELIGTASIPGDAKDKSGLTEVLADGTPHNRLGSFGSAITYTGVGRRYIAVDDRGPADGKSGFRDRFQTFDIDVTPGGSPAVKVELISTTLVSDEHGRPLIGSVGAFDADDQAKGARLDPEGIRLSPAGSLWVSDEYGPWIDEFSMDGRRLRRLRPPAKFMAAHPAADPADELPPRNTSGRQPNRGLEGLAIAPDGSRLFAILQSPLIQDGALNPEGKKAGTNLRIVELNPATGATREFLYRLESPSHGVNELLAINDHEFLVLERDGKAGAAAKARGLYRIDLSEASDISAIQALPAAGAPAGIRPVTKKPFLDFMDPRFGLAGPTMPEKIEGLAFGPDLPDGRHLLIVTIDNDLKANTPSLFWAFAVAPPDLPGLVPQALPSKPAASAGDEK